MIITKELLGARKIEITQQRDQARASVAACDGALQTLDLLLITLDAPEPPPEAIKVDKPVG